MRAYREENKEYVVNGFAAMMDFALRVKRRDAEEFIRSFVRGGVADGLGRADAFLIGLSGVELYEKVTGEKCFEEHILPEKSELLDKMRAVACFQFESGKSFKDIFRVLPVKKMLSESFSCTEELAELYEKSNKKRPTNLEYFRSEAGLSQSELAALSGVDIRSIQMYEQRRNDVSKAQYNILNALARALQCTVSDLTDEDNYRLPKGEEEENPTDTFLDLCMLEARRREFSSRDHTPSRAQKRARVFFYAYGYLVAFPFKRLAFEKGVYSIDGETLKNSFTNYFYRVLESKKMKESARAQAKGQIAALCPSGKKLTPSALVQAVLSAAYIAEEA